MHKPRPWHWKQHRDIQGEREPREAWQLETTIHYKHRGKYK